MSDHEAVQAGKVVSIRYTLRLADGRVVDGSETGEPVPYLHGGNNIVAGLERALEGRKPGDRLRVTVPPQDGFGARRPDAVQTVRRDVFPESMQKSLAPGVTFRGVDDLRNPITGVVQSVEDDRVVIDLNHPLAGEDLHFEVEVAAVRDASPAEEARGDVLEPADEEPEDGEPDGPEPEAGGPAGQDSR